MTTPHWLGLSRRDLARLLEPSASGDMITFVDIFVTHRLKLPAVKSRQRSRHRLIPPRLGSCSGSATS